MAVDQELFDLSDRILNHAKSLLSVAERIENPQERQQVVNLTREIVNDAISLSNTARRVAQLRYAVSST